MNQRATAPWAKFNLMPSKKASVSEIKTKKTGYKVREPVDKNGFGHVVWQILGGGEAYLTRDCKRLNISDSSLSGIIHGSESISQNGLIERQWREAFAEHYPTAWAKHQAVFEERAAKLRHSSKNNLKEPQDKLGLGHTLWRIIGGVNAHVSATAPLFKTQPQMLGDLIHSRMDITSRMRNKMTNKWPDVFAEAFPEAWKENKEIYNRQLATPGKWAAKPKEKKNESDDGTDVGDDVTNVTPVYPNWHQAVGEFVGKTLADRGDTVGDIISDVRRPILKDEGKWEKILAGDQSISPTIFRNAIEEVCELYCIEPIGVETQKLVAAYTTVLLEYCASRSVARADREEFPDEPSPYWAMDALVNVLSAAGFDNE